MGRVRVTQLRELKNRLGEEIFSTYTSLLRPVLTMLLLVISGTEEERSWERDYEAYSCIYMLGEKRGF